MSKGSPCPACASPAFARPFEERQDPIAGEVYRLGACPDCGVVYSEPRRAVGPDWYEKAAPIRAQETRSGPEEDWRFLRFFSEGFPPGRLLDVGCGDGGFLALAKDRGFSVLGFDYEERMVALARARGLPAESAAFEDFCARQPAGAFEFVTLFDALEHFPEPAEVVSRLKRLMKPGAVLVTTLPNARRPLPFGREEHDYPPHHFTRWTPSAMRGFLERQGFRVATQDAGLLKVYFLKESLFFYVFMPPLLGLARKLLFGKKEGTISDLYAKKETGAEPGGLSDKLTRQRMVNALKAVCSPFLYLVAWPMWAYYRLTRPDCGDCLYTSARLESRSLTGLYGL